MDRTHLLDRMTPNRRLFVVLIHAVITASAYGLALLLRFDFRVTSHERVLFLETVLPLITIRAVVFALFRVDEGLWPYVGLRDLIAIAKATSIGSLLFVGVALAMVNGFPRTVFALDWLLTLTGVASLRLILRAVRESDRGGRYDARKRALIIGAGDGGELLAREIDRRSGYGYEVIGFVDDDHKKQGLRIHQIPVIGTIDQLPDLCRRSGAEELLIALPSAGNDAWRRAVERCRESGIPFKSVPDVYQLLQGTAKIGQLREVRPEDLLGREAVQLDPQLLRGTIEGRRILVTGAAGSIGSELSRQLAVFHPDVLVLFDRAESNLFHIDLELRHAHPSLHIVPVVGDVTDQPGVDAVMDTFRPELLYHAAAYKHVPMLEKHPLEAIVNNVFGTDLLARSAQRIGLKKFVLISSDKAVRPVSIMGMTKRVAECVLQSYEDGPTTFVAVRFGNVLGSDGSVLPVFQRQIARGGPVTVTDPEATRYFMLISEAAQLVLQAGIMGEGGEIFFLDMGEPIRILDLAHNMIRLSGLEPGRDVAVKITGLRPGERLRETLVMEHEKLLPTVHEKVFMVQNDERDHEAFQDDLMLLKRCVDERQADEAAAHLRLMSQRH